MQALIQNHVNAIQDVLTAAESDLSQITDEGLRDECAAGLKLVHDVAAMAFKRLQRRCPEQTDGVELLSGPVEK